MVDGNIEESLYLVCMEIHGDDTIDTCGREQVGNKLGTDGHTGLVLSVLSCPAEVGDYRIDGTGRGTLGGINHQQQFHQIVAVGECALNEEDVASTNTLLVGYRKLAVRELGDKQFAERTTQTLADFLCEVLCGCT